MMFQLCQVLFGNKLCNIAGLTAKIPYISQCYTIDIEIQNEPATASFIMSSWEFPYALPWLKKMDCNHDIRVDSWILS